MRNKKSTADDLMVFRFPKHLSLTAALGNRVPPLRLLMQPGTLCIEILESGLFLGRHSTADIRLSLPDVSRKHCRFLYGDRGWEIEDLGSLNGVYVNDIRTRRAVLNPGDNLRIAGLDLVVVKAGDVGPADVASAEENNSAAVLQRIAKVLPGRFGERTQEFKEAG